MTAIQKPACAVGPTDPGASTMHTAGLTRQAKNGEIAPGQQGPNNKVFPMVTLEQLEAAAAIVRAVMPPTPQICWPLLGERCGVELWVKHENHTPIGAFKLRGGLNYMAQLRRAEPDV